MYLEYEIGVCFVKGHTVSEGDCIMEESFMECFHHTENITNVRNHDNSQMALLYRVRRHDNKKY